MGGKACKDVSGTWNLALTKLPLKHDEAESERVNRTILEMVQAQNQELLGANNANIGKVLGLMAELYKSEYTAPETDEGIKKIFGQVPQAALAE